MKGLPQEKSSEVFLGSTGLVLIHGGGCLVLFRYPRILSPTSNTSNIVLWWPIFIISLFVIVLWREFNCVKIPQGEANKSANRWGNLRAKGGVVPPLVYMVRYLAFSCADKIHSFYTTLLLISTLNSTNCLT
jgi:hypothetical protein